MATRKYGSQNYNKQPKPVPVEEVDLPQELATSPVDAVLPAKDFRDEFPLIVMQDVPAEPEPEKVQVEVSLSPDLYEAYAKVAEAQGQTIEEVLSHRLKTCQTHNALRGLWFGDVDRGQLETALGKKPLSSPSQVIQIINQSLSFNLGEINMSFTPSQLKTLKMRMYGGLTPDKFFKSLFVRELGA